MAKMKHLARLIDSTKAQVIFISENRNSSISAKSLKSCFNLDSAHVIPAQGQSGGLWLFVKSDLEVDVVSVSQYYFFCLCTVVQTRKKFGLVCLYGDPHHQKTAMIWAQVRSFVVTNMNLPILCMVDLNNIMHANEKLGPNSANKKHISDFCYFVKSCGFFDLGYNGPDYTWTNKRFSTTPTYERLDRCLANAEWCATFPYTSVHYP